MYTENYKEYLIHRRFRLFSAFVIILLVDVVVDSVFFFGFLFVLFGS